MRTHDESGGTRAASFIEPGSAQQLAETLLGLSTDTERIADMGARARAMLEAHFTRGQAFERWRHVLDHID